MNSKSPTGKTWLVLIVVLLLLLVAGWVFNGFRPKPAGVRLTLSGTPGLKVAGTYVVDGVTNDYTGALPATITLQARNFEYTIRMQEPKGELRGELLVEGGLTGSSATQDDFRGVRGSFQQWWGSRAIGLMTTMEKGD